jgi:hypothetical protein
MGRDYIPNQDDAFSVWFSKYVQYAQMHNVELGLSDPQVSELVAARDQWAAVYNLHLVAKDAARAGRRPTPSGKGWASRCRTGSRRPWTRRPSATLTRRS